MSSILVKFRIDNQHGKTLFSTTDYKALIALGLEENKEFNTWEIQIGNSLSIGDTKYTVKSVYTVIHKDIVPNTGKYGFSLVVEGEYHDFNFEIVYYVE